MRAGQHIDYDALALEALRGVVKACLAQVAQGGLVGDHHFYIAFNTQAPGIGLSKRLKEKYPQEMTIVLQHRFWDLAVDDDRFEVKLTFDGIPERLVVPFKAVKVFYDPSVPYGLQFEESEPSATPDAARRSTRRAVALAKDGDPRGAVEAGVDTLEREGDKTLPRRSRPERGAGSEERREPRAPTPAPERPAASVPQSVPSVPAKPAAVAVVKGAGEDAKQKPAESEPTPEGGAKIFDLAKFRGKK